MELQKTVVFSGFTQLRRDCHENCYHHVEFHRQSEDITRFRSDFDLVSGRYVIDAKSIMGIFSLDLSRPITLNIHNEDEIDTILEVLKPYIC